MAYKDMYQSVFDFIDFFHDMATEQKTDKTDNSKTNFLAVYKQLSDFKKSFEVLQREVEERYNRLERKIEEKNKDLESKLDESCRDLSDQFRSEISMIESEISNGKISRNHFQELEAKDKEIFVLTNKIAELQKTIDYITGKFKF
jgi:DNA-binding transcriptional regulator GbsR (MarR family)